MNLFEGFEMGLCLQCDGGGWVVVESVWVGVISLL